MFSLTLPLLSAAASEKSLKQVKRSSKLVKRSSRRTEHNFAYERIRQEQSKRRKVPEETKFVRTVVEAVCLLQQFVCLLFVPGEVFKDKERTEL